MTSITENDKYVLNAIFNPNYPLDFDKDSPSDLSNPQNDTKSLEIKKIEEEGVRLAEQNRLLEAIECFSQAIALNPNNPSAYNNRAQAYQLQNNTDEAMIDLTKSIDLSLDVKHHQKTCSLALTQRGILHRFLGNEKESLNDFTQAAELGSAFAKQQVLLSNPYAAACNQMLSKMMKQLSHTS
uniref:Tetratricopeptide repeat containing protein n=1 Tax=Adineta vaga TaxID=104782 RepID=B3G401_ADIVA|nr:tetratricopeptide repeat containing protein [Adineta vaga]